jgi:ribosomal protein RSM22 (predicted rRNA methylase)
MTTIRSEIDSNFDAFQRHLSASLAEHRGEFALLRHGRIVDYFEGPGAALVAANQRFPDQLFSIQEVSDEPIDLGVWSHA